MKRIIIKSFIFGLSILSLTSSVHAGLLSGIPEETQKNPLSVKVIQGNPSTRYSVVETIITSNPTTKGDPKKLIQRSELGIIGPEGNAINRNVTLRVPQLGFDIKSNLTDIVPEVVGAVSPNPKVQVAAAAAGSLVEEGLAFLSKELNKGYDNQQKEIRVLELLPSKYYAIDATNNTVIVKDNFKTDLPLYLQAQATIVPIANELNKAKVEYNKMVKTWQELEKQKKFDEADKYVDQMDLYREQTIIPIEKRFLAAAQDVEKYSMHRILIMTDPEGPANIKSCGDGLNGRWNLLLYFYLGAKQTNRIKVGFCVPDTKADQGLIVDLKKNQIVKGKDGEFRLEDGGIAFKSAADKNITFPADIEAERVAWKEPESERINWFREMVTAEDATDLNGIMFPFDLLKIAKDIKAQEDEEGKKRWEKTRKAIKEMKEKGGLPKDAEASNELQNEIEAEEEEEEPTGNKKPSSKPADKTDKDGKKPAKSDKKSPWYQKVFGQILDKGPKVLKFIKSNQDTIKNLFSSNKDTASQDTQISIIKKDLEKSSNKTITFLDVLDKLDQQKIAERDDAGNFKKDAGSIVYKSNPTDQEVLTAITAFQKDIDNEQKQVEAINDKLVALQDKNLTSEEKKTVDGLLNIAAMTLENLTKMEAAIQEALVDAGDIT